MKNQLLEICYIEVPVDVRKPKKEGYYRCIVDNGSIVESWYYPKNEMFGATSLKITHWLEKKEDQLLYSRTELMKFLLELNPQIEEDSKFTNPFLYDDIRKWYKELAALTKQK
jgi:hypothetical protein